MQKDLLLLILEQNRYTSLQADALYRAGRQACSWAILFRRELFFHQRQARVGVFPCGANPDVLAIFGDGKGTGGAG